MTQKIKYIALCGAPESGKSEVQRLLTESYNFQGVDDSRSLREAAMLLYGLEDWHVSTQEGKATRIEVGNEIITVRKILGELGLHLEKRDPHHIPKRALEDATLSFPNQRLSFGSVRRDQAKVFKNTGQALIVEIQRPGFYPVNAFDEYDKSLVDISLLNEYDPEDPQGSSIKLLKQIQEKIEPLL